MIRRAKEKLVLQYDSTVNFFADAFMRMRTHEGFKRYFKNTGWLFLGRMAGLIANFFVSTYIARYLGPNNFGLMNFAISFASISTFFAGFGIDSIVVRNLVSQPGDRNKILGTSLGLKIVSSLIAIVTTIFAAFLFNSDWQARVLIIAFSFFTIFQSFNVIDLYFQSKVLSKLTMKIQIGVVALSTLLKLIFVYFKLGILPFVLIYVFEHFAMAIGLIVLYLRRERLFEWTFNKALAKATLKSSWPLVLAAASASIYLRIDQVIIKFMLDEKAVGVYAVAVKFSEVWYFIPGLICASLFPAIINAKSSSRHLYELRLRRLYSLMFFLGLGVSFVTVIFAKPLIVILFGHEYDSAIGPLRIYAWSNIGVFLGAAVNQYLISEDFTKIAFLTTFIGMIVNVLLNLILIPYVGITGAAWATLVSYIIATYSIFLFSKTRKHARMLLTPFYFR